MFIVDRASSLQEVDFHNLIHLLSSDLKLFSNCFVLFCFVFNFPRLQAIGPLCASAVFQPENFT